MDGLVTTQPVLTLMAHSLAIVTPVTMVTVSIVSILTNVRLELIIVIKTQCVLTISVPIIALVIMDTVVMESHALMLTNAAMRLYVMTMQSVLTLMAHSLALVILIISAMVLIVVRSLLQIQ